MLYFSIESIYILMFFILGLMLVNTLSYLHYLSLTLRLRGDGDTGKGMYDHMTIIA